LVTSRHNNLTKPPRVLQKCLDDPTCGKIILTRNPLDSYVSRQIAGVTGQWKLTNIKHQKTAIINFDRVEFSAHLETTQAFQTKVLNALQTSGQTAFYIGYDDLHSVDVLNGLARFLGSDHQVEELDRSLKKQNPASLESKVSNYSEMIAELSKIDFMGLSRTPNFEPNRGAGVPQFVLGNKTPIVFLPISGAPVDGVKTWLAKQDGVQPAELLTGLNQKQLREWRQDHPGFKTASVLRHPVLRAYLCFCDVILAGEFGKYRDLRQKVIKQFKIKLPKDGESPDIPTQKAGFLAFLRFLKLNLTNQTSLRIDPIWASQTAIMEGAASVLMSGHIVHESQLAPGIAYLETILGLPAISIEGENTSRTIELGDIYDTEIEARVRDIYGRDYLNFGFVDWEN
jgi:hypothetical protein